MISLPRENEARTEDPQFISSTLGYTYARLFIRMFFCLAEIGNIAAPPNTASRAEVHCIQGCTIGITRQHILDCLGHSTLSDATMDIMRPAGESLLTSRFAAQFPYALTGNLEKLYTTRHALGLYRSVIVNCRYRLAKSIEKAKLRDVVFLALCRVIKQHAALCCAITGEDTETPSFKRVASINLAEIVTFVPLDDPSTFSEHFSQYLEQMWQKIDQRPPWKLVVFHQAGEQIDTINATFLYHHGIADGLGGAAFHRAFLKELNATRNRPETSMETPELVEVPTDTKLADPIEKLIKIPISLRFLASQVLQEYGPRMFFKPKKAPWAGRKCEALDTLPYKCRSRLVSIPATAAAALLEEARKEKSTITALFNGVIVVALAEAVPTAASFIGCTPYTMRRVTGTSMDVLTNETTGLDTLYDEKLLDDVRSNLKKSADRKPVIWQAARFYHELMTAELKKCPKDNPVGLIPYIANFRTFYEKKIGHPREIAFELSNLGAFKAAEAQEVGGWEVDDAIFSQSPQVVGAAVNVNLASAVGGALNLTFTWQDGVLEESVIDGIVREVQNIVN